MDYLTNAACFYACDVNVGKFKKYNQCSKKVRLRRERKGGLHFSDTLFLPWYPTPISQINNEWEISNLPLRSGDCDALFNICGNDQLAMPPGGNVIDNIMLGECTPISQLYSSSKDFCEKFFRGAFAYDTSYDALTFRPQVGARS